jgi:hypothetical protein
VERDGRAASLREVGSGTTAAQKEEFAKLTAEDHLLRKLKQLHGDLDAVNSTSGDNS